MSGYILNHLEQLEAESIFIIREVTARFRKPVMLYSIGKDSSVLLHLARLAFHPASIPFPLLHIDTGWKFRAMIDFRNEVAAEPGIDLRVWQNEEGLRRGVNPFDHGSDNYTHVMKTEALREAIAKSGFDAAIGGARRDEERSRAKERVFSFRDRNQQWEPRSQRPELWNLYNTRIAPGESMRVFPLSNWTEIDVWFYILHKQIPVVPLYFAQERPVVERDGSLIMVDDDRMRLSPTDSVTMRRVRFRTLGCYPLTGAIESQASNVEEIIEEMLVSRQSERQGRLIDHDTAASMERKKREGYF